MKVTRLKKAHQILQYDLGIQFKVLHRLNILINTNGNYEWRKCNKKT